jgi:hypothetical protein
VLDVGGLDELLAILFLDACLDEVLEFIWVILQNILCRAAVSKSCDGIEIETDLEGRPGF